MHELIVYKLLNKIRNGRDHMTMSELMGFNYNQYFKFEAGYKIFRLEDFIRLSSLEDKINLIKTLKDSLSINIEILSQETIIEAIGLMWGAPSEQIIKEKLNFSKSKWWRIRNGKSPISLIDFLKLIDLTTGKLNHFLECVLSPKEIANLLYTSCDYNIAMEKIREFPEITLITAALYTRVYRDAPKTNKLQKLKEISKVPSPLFEDLLKVIVKYKICDEIEGQLESHSFKPEFRDSDLELGNDFFLFSQRLLEKKLKHTKLDRMTYKIAPVSKDSMNLIQRELRESYQRISKIIENEPVEKKDDIMIFSQGMYCGNSNP